MTTTHWHQLADHQTAHVLCNGLRVHGVEFEVSAYAERTLVEIKSAGENGILLLAHSAHDAMVEVTAELRKKVAEVAKESEYVAVLIRTPLTVLPADVPPRLATYVCLTCAGCQEGGDCLAPVWVADEDGNPMTLPGTMGYCAYTIAAIIGAPEPITLPDAMETFTEEPWWMIIPDFDEAKVRSLPLSVWENRFRLMDLLMPTRS